MNQRAAKCRDMIVNPSDLSTSWSKDHLNYFTLSLGREPLKYSNSALSQHLNRIGVPVHFYRKCPNKIKSDIYGHFNRTHKNSFMFRLNHAVDKNHIRAVLSKSYSVIDDVHLFDVVFNCLADREDVSYHVFRYDSHITQLLVNFNDCNGELQSGNFTAGLCITNSETGHSSIWIEPVVHWNHHTLFNRRVLSPQKVDCRIVHRGKLQADKIPAMVEKAKEISQIGIFQADEASRTDITGNAAISFVQNIDAFPARFTHLLSEEWQDKKAISKLEAGKRIIELAQELPLFQRIGVEQSAGKMLGLFNGFEARFSDLAAEIGL